MKIFLFLMVLSIGQLLAIDTYSQKNKLTLGFNRIKLVEVLDEIENQTEYFFLFNEKLIDMNREVSIHVKDQGINEILDMLFKGTNVDYQIVERKIVLSPKASAQSPQKSAVSGKVRDAEGLPLPGVSVVIKGTTQGTITDFDGNYSLQNVSGDAFLVFSFVGMRTQEVKVAGKTAINIEMTEETVGIEEVVAVGYGVQKKVNLTGAVSQISAKELDDRPVPKLSQALQGAIPNLNVTLAGGTPGQDASINVRGFTSINGGEPLVLIDGIPGNINRLTSQEVESITVLKDAAASAIYGARGAWGVVLVTTKNAKTGKATINYSNNFGWSTPTVSTDFITTGYDWMRLNDASIAHVGGYSRYNEQDMQELYIRRNDKKEHPDRPWVTVQNRTGRDQYVYYGNYDWWDIMFKEWQSSMNHNLNLTGGDERWNYMLNSSYNTKSGIMKLDPDNYEAFTLRSKIGSQVLSWLEISNNTNFYYSSYEYHGRKGGGNANFSSINVHASPAYAPINPDGTASYITGLNSYTIGDGLYAILVDGNTKGRNTKYEFRTTSEAKIKISKDLTVTTNYSYNLYTDPGFYRQYPATYSLYPGVSEIVSKANVNQLEEWQSFNHIHVINSFATYNKSFGAHEVRMMAGYNQELHLAKRISATRKDILSPVLNDLNLGTGDQTVGGGQSALALRGVFYRMNYNYKDKYLFETNGRYDGTSRFPKGNRFGFFPSVSAGWRISEESFFKEMNTGINSLKIRASYGSLGNQSTSDLYMYVPRMSGGTMGYILDGERAKVINPPNPVSGDLTWEKIKSTNLGIDLYVLSNRLGFVFDVYRRNTTEMLDRAAALPLVFGATEPVVNVADLKTEGFDLTVSWKSNVMLGGKKLKYNISGMLSDNRSVITKMNNATGFTYNYYEGKKIGEIWGFVTNGYFKTEAEALNYPVDQSYLNVVRNDNHIGLSAGDLRFEDLDGDGVITSGTNTVENPGDQKVLGNSTPRYSFGLNINADYGNFDFSIFFQGIGKYDWYPGNEADRFWGPYSRPYFTFIPKDFEEKIWTPENPNAYFPRLLTYIALNARNELRATNNRYMQDLAYCRLKNLTLGYTLPKNLSQKLQISKCRVYVSGENLLTFTKLETKYIDPEQAIANNNARVYPFSKTYSVGVNVTF